MESIPRQPLSPPADTDGPAADRDRFLAQSHSVGLPVESLISGPRESTYFYPVPVGRRGAAVGSRAFDLPRVRALRTGCVCLLDDGQYGLAGDDTENGRTGAATVLRSACSTAVTHLVYKTLDRHSSQRPLPGSVKCAVGRRAAATELPTEILRRQTQAARGFRLSTPFAGPARCLT
jgi:hypothetical protein